MRRRRQLGLFDPVCLLCTDAPTFGVKFKDGWSGPLLCERHAAIFRNVLVPHEVRRVG